MGELINDFYLKSTLPIIFNEKRALQAVALDGFENPITTPPLASLIAKSEVYRDCSLNLDRSTV
jgi:hypothetical protein